MADKTETFQMRISPLFRRQLDEWRRAQSDIPSVAESIRRLTVMGLEQQDTKKKASK